MFKPLLAASDSPETNPGFFTNISFPVYASPKLDGIRCIVKDNVCYSRTFKPIPSYQVQEDFNHLNFFDGELIEGDERDPAVYNRTQSHVMSEDKPGDVVFHVFDYIHPEVLNLEYEERYQRLLKMFEDACLVSNRDIKLVKQKFIPNLQELLEYEQQMLTQGYEGIMIRAIDAPYKQGRSTFREGILLKLKRFSDDEGLILSFKEQYTNENPLEQDELGYAKRSQSKDGLVPANTLGNFIISYRGQTLDVAPGMFNHHQRKVIWDNQDTYIGKLLKFRFFSHGVKDKPRFPRAIGIRDVSDI